MEFIVDIRGADPLGPFIKTPAPYLLHTNLGLRLESAGVTLRV